MVERLWPIVLIVACSCIYNICAKGTPADVNSFASLMVSYMISVLVTGILFIVSVKGKQPLQELRKIDWTSIVLGIAIVGVEVGNIFMYRVGWKIGVGTMVFNIAVVCILLLIGVFVYKEVVSVRQYVGILVCCVGLILITK